MAFLSSRFFRDLRNRILCGGTSLAVRMLLATNRYRVCGWEPVRSWRERGEGAIFILWHNVLMLPLGHECRLGSLALISSGRDGDFAERVVARFGIGTVRGSSSRGAIRALREFGRGGGAASIAITPDGPRGPRYSFKGGAAWLASRLGLPIVPVGIAVTRCWHLKSWDRFRIPKPFARVELVFGPVIDAPRGPDRKAVEDCASQAERSLREASAEAARRAGVPWPD